ncbi:thermonuclease family protein [Deinococcus yavapaiensis]|uniref:Nuclease-like protein n=1 Tax=Deinococcus yavapaiensis KR-236 TaxID=694435 RepID=A0A318SH60_9DEIO|nr:hypothetical protein [Deinococcus yavapaiensis]PYE49991.1 hypothetical protein DES52_11911 [Deinococcus yavapaiensis KR-236]
MTRVLLAVVALSLQTPTVARTTLGVPSVIDGDTLDIRGVRLHGVDAPESSRTCTKGGRTHSRGREVANALAEKVRDTTVACTQILARFWSRTAAIAELMTRPQLESMGSEISTFSRRRGV